MHASWILLCMSLILLSYASLINKEGIGMRKKSEGGLACSIPWPVVGGVCYRLVSEPQVETSSRYGLGLLVETLGQDRNLTVKLKILGGMTLQKLCRRHNDIDPL
jgi:hypothetical protein